MASFTSPFPSSSAAAAAAAAAGSSPRPLLSARRTLNPLSSPSPRKPARPYELSNPDAGLRWRARVSFFPSFLRKKEGKSPDALKEELFEAIAPLDRGAEATPEDQKRVDQIARELEAINSIKEPLKSDLLNGKWELLYTTSRSLLANQRPKFLRPNGKIYQAINADTLRAQNMETWPFFNQVTANLVPLNARRVTVKFDTFKIAGLNLSFCHPLPREFKLRLLDCSTTQKSYAFVLYQFHIRARQSKALTALTILAMILNNIDIIAINHFINMAHNYGRFDTELYDEFCHRSYYYGARRQEKK